LHEQVLPILKVGHQLKEHLQWLAAAGAGWAKLNHNCLQKRLLSNKNAGATNPPRPICHQFLKKNAINFLPHFVRIHRRRQSKDFRVLYQQTNKQNQGKNMWAIGDQ